MGTLSLSYSSITKKIIVSLAGLFLVIFLLIHLSINLFLLRNDNGEWFNAAAHFMGTNYVVRVFEIVLMGGFLLHMIVAVIVQIKNWFSRPVRYAISNKSKTPFLSKYMIYTGGIVLVFLIIHFMNFYFIKLGFVESPIPLDKGDPNFYKVAVYLFGQPVYAILYILLMIALGFHLNHAFGSAFQTLGLNHQTYSPFIDKLGTCYSIIVPLGFSIIPIYFWLLK